MAYYRSRFLTKDKIKPNNTPMIDITFLLLIFFMVTLHLNPQEGSLTHKMDDGHRFPIVKDHHIEEIHIGFIQDGETKGFFVGENLFQGANRFRQLRKVLLQIHQVNPVTHKVNLHPEKGTAYGEVFRVMDLCQSVNKITSGGSDKFLEVRFMTTH